MKVKNKSLDALVDELLLEDTSGPNEVLDSLLAVGKKRIGDNVVALWYQQVWMELVVFVNDFVELVSIKLIVAVFVFMRNPLLNMMHAPSVSS